jgi:GntR family transcriptional regulator / MocR family aminotransferase
VDLHVSLAGRGDLAARIYRQVRDAILDGRLRPGERLPASRELAGRLKVSRNTVAVAYERLTAEGFLAGRVGAGTFVSATPVGPARRTPRKARAAPAGREVRPRGLWRSIPTPPAVDAAAAAPAYDFRVGVPDAGLFPFQAWRRLVARELRPSAIRSGSYGEPAGHAGLRAAIARHIAVARSVRATADDVLVTQGAQQALDLVGRVLVEPGTCVAVEDPGYPPAALLFRSLGARVVGVPVDAEGLDVARLPAAARLVYVTPSHQFPLGAPMSLARRAALLGWAERAGAVLIEDDYDSEYRFSDRPLEPLQNLDRSGRVVYVGTFSKTLLPLLRLGFLVPPASLWEALRNAKRLADWHGDLATQGALAGFIDEGLLARHVRKATREYALRHELVVAGLERYLADWLEPVPSAAGLHLCARLAEGAAVDLGAAVALAADAGVAVNTLAQLRADAGRPGTPGRDGLVLGYGAVRPDRIMPGLRRLAASLAVTGRPSRPAARSRRVSVSR